MFSLIMDRNTINNSYISLPRNQAKISKRVNYTKNVSFQSKMILPNSNPSRKSLMPFLTKAESYAKQALKNFPDFIKQLIPLALLEMLRESIVLNNDSKEKNLFVSYDSESAQVKDENIKPLSEIVKNSQLDSELINSLIEQGYGNKLEVLLNKINVDEYANELNLILSRVYMFSNNRNPCSEIFNENISQNELEFLLETQRMLSKSKNKVLRILDNNIFSLFIGKDKTPDEVLNKLRYYYEVTSDSGTANNNISMFDCYNTIRLYKNNPTQIPRIENLLYDNQFEVADQEQLLLKLSFEPKILDKQLLLLENVLKHVDSYRDEIPNIVNSNDSLDDVEAKLTVFEKIKQKFSKIRIFIDSFKNFDDVYFIIDCLTGTDKQNKNSLLLALDNEKYKYEISRIANMVSDSNVELVEHMLKRGDDKILPPDMLVYIANVTYHQKLSADFIKKYFDEIPIDSMSDLAYSLSGQNQNLIRRLYTDKELDFPKYCIADIAARYNLNNAGLVEELCTNKNLNFPAGYIAKVAKSITSSNLALAKELCTNKSLNYPTAKIAELLESAALMGYKMYTISLAEKLNAYDLFTKTPKDILNICSKNMGIDFEKKLVELAKELGCERNVVSVLQEQQKAFFKDFLANNNPEAEHVLRTFDFEQYGRKGLPLKYSRKHFTENVENLLKELTPDEQDILLEHFGLEKGVVGFDGLPTNKPFVNQEVSPKVHEVAGKIKQEIEAFTTKNSIETGDSVANKTLNSLLAGFPEFTYVVGKEQHGTHAYSVDIHSLKVLQSAMNHPLYSQLSDKDKTVLKFAAICHDLGKHGGVVDSGHASISARYAISIFNKFQFPQNLKNRIVDIIDNHHWFEAYNTGKITAQDVALRCRYPNDSIIYQILAKADFENVNKDFHLIRSGGLKNQAEFDEFMQNKMHKITEALSNVYSKANLIFDTPFMENGVKFPKQTVMLDGTQVTFKVLNFNKLSKNESLQKYGFAKGVTKNDARFFVHMTEPTMTKLESVDVLTENPLNQSAWSVSLIKALCNSTYGNQSFGFVFEIPQSNIAEAYSQNLGSGAEKNIYNFEEILFNEKNEQRTFVRDSLLEELKNNGISLNKLEYAQLSKYLLTKKYLSQITNDIKIGGQLIKASVLTSCLEKSREKLFEETQVHNEIVAINPKIKGLIVKGKTLDECPKEFLYFAQKHDLPIILMKDEYS